MFFRTVVRSLTSSLVNATIVVSIWLMSFSRAFSMGMDVCKATTP